MHKLVQFPLVIILIVAVFNLLLGDSFGSTVVEAGSTTVRLNVDALTGMIPWIIGLALATAFIGFNIFGSGVQEEGAHILATAIVYACIWGGLSTFTWGWLTSIPVFGLFIWLLLTILYAAGALISLTARGGAGGGE